MQEMTNETVLFTDIDLSTPLARAVEDMQYKEATTIQAAAIPYLLAGRDVIGRSSTGTGKTAAFGIPAVECVAGDVKKAQVLVISPTRELAMQIAREMQKYAKYKEGIRVAAVYGGASMGDQIRQLRQANIVIGTPGRLMDHLRRRTLKLADVKMVVLDEADEMLSMGFVDDITEILSQAPAERQTVLFSATMPEQILKISEEFLTEPEMVDVMRESAAKATIEQTFYYVPHNRKQDALGILLRSNEARSSVIFCNTKAMVDELNEKLCAEGFKAAGLHGDMTQAIRTQVMGRFRAGSVQILVATDVAARGIDVDEIDAVINYDLPQSFEYYVHRIGRTGRAGNKGVSQTLITNGKQMQVLKSLMRFTGFDIEERRLPSGAEMQAAALQKLAASLQEAKPGRGARVLLEKLMEEGTAEEAALLLAEAVLADNAAFAPIEDIAQKPQRPKKVRWISYSANVGKAHKVKPDHLIGALVEALDVERSQIGRIDIKKDRSFLQVSEPVARTLFGYKKTIRINGVKVKFSPAAEERREKRGPAPKR